MHTWQRFLMFIWEATKFGKLQNGKLHNFLFALFSIDSRLLVKLTENKTFFPSRDFVSPQFPIWQFACFLASWMFRDVCLGKNQGIFVTRGLCNFFVVSYLFNCQQFCNNCEFIQKLKLKFHEFVPTYVGKIWSTKIAFIDRNDVIIQNAINLVIYPIVTVEKLAQHTRGRRVQIGYLFLTKMNPQGLVITIIAGIQMKTSMGLGA